MRDTSVRTLWTLHGTTSGSALLAAALAPLWLGSPAAAQQRPEPAPPERPPRRAEQPPEEKPLFLERLDVEIVNLDVIVTDSDGDPIDGLTRADFVLKVDGRPTPIENFYAIGLGEGRASPAGDGAAGSAATAAPPAPEQELHVLILFDSLHSRPGERQRVVNALADEFEDGLGWRGRAAVAFYDSGIRVRQPFTADGAAVAAAIRELGTEQMGFGDDLEERVLLREIEQVLLTEDRVTSGQAADDAEGVFAAIELYAEQRAVEVQRRLAALTWKIESLAGLPGRKVLLYVTGGLDMRPGQALYSAWQGKFGGLARRENAIAPVSNPSSQQLAIGNADLGSTLRELTRQANSGGVALYVIGIAGAGTGSSLSAEVSGFDSAGLSTPGVGRTFDQTSDSVHSANLNSGLELMAAVTGGEALTGAGAYGRMPDQIGQDAVHRYSLGFRAPEAEPGSRHKVEVALAGYDVKLRYRQEFVTATAAQRASERTRAALLWDRADNQLGVAVDLNPTQPSKQGKGLVVLPLLVKVPFTNLVLLPEPQFHRGQITIFVVAEDDKGGLSPVQTIEAPIRIPSARLEEAMRGVAGYRLGLVVRPGKHRLAIGVRDELGDVVSALVVEHDVAAPAKEG